MAAVVDTPAIFFASSSPEKTSFENTSWKYGIQDRYKLLLSFVLPKQNRGSSFQFHFATAIAIDNTNLVTYFNTKSIAPDFYLYEL